MEYSTKEYSPAYNIISWNKLSESYDHTMIFGISMIMISLIAKKEFNPLISNIDEIREVKTIIAEIKEQLRRENIAFKDDVKLGIMVETPSVAIHSKAYAKEVDFFSIGTNDLIQYTFAIDRCNKDISHLYDEFNPAILKQIKMTIDNGHEAGIEVAMCGEAASNPKLIPLFIAMGLDVFSMDPSHILMCRYIINNSSKYELSRDMDTILELSTGEEVERYLCKYMISI